MSNPQKPKGKAPVIIPRKISRWIAENSTNGYVNNYKVSGGRPAWNGRK
ncbi:hypothetical protein M4D57_18810 [Brevibacillus borstelensis]|nr:hypothetical protein [Brevibacillus borstelensis]MCM3560620.1 hypothetical protein [Brevibacillus borstelensis]